MKTVWIVLNRGSRTVGEDWDARLTAAFEARGAVVAGVTDFPHDPLPEPAALDRAKVDTVAVAAGDGTINALAQTLDNWPGVLLVLPGGTMNLLAKSLHGDATPEVIVAAVADPPQTRAVTTVDADGARALVGVIVGPGASWVHAREAVRKGRWGRLRRTVRLAWLRSLSSSVRLREGRKRSRGYRAIFIHPDGDVLSVVRVRASGWTDGVRLGFSYLVGNWATARGIETGTAETLQLVERRPVFALFDGEPLRLSPDARLTMGHTRLRFVVTA